MGQRHESPQLGGFYFLFQAHLNLSSSSQKSSFSYQAVFFPGFWEFGSLFFSRHKNLHVLKSGMVANFCLESHLVFWYRFTYVFIERMIEFLIIIEDRITEVFPVSNKQKSYALNPFKHTCKFQTLYCCFSLLIFGSLNF